jgi:ketosteroid isomerase-like protein
MLAEARAMPRTILALLAVAALVANNAESADTPNAELQDQLRKTEAAFARTMADRDHAAFASFLTDETVFFGRNVLRGKAAVAAAWKRFYEGPAAPFSWAPTDVEVLDSGTLGYSSGPVFDAAGNRVGTFNSVWRLEPDGAWKIVFDKGCPECDGAPKPAVVPAGAKGIAALAWMAGDWQTAPGKRRVDEHWTAPAGGAMLGMSRTVSGEALSAFEYLRIVERADGIFYIAHPGASSPGTEFKMTRVADGEAVFENPEHDFPKRITYRRGADGALTATVDGGEGTKALAFVFSRSAR